MAKSYNEQLQNSSVFEGFTVEEINKLLGEVNHRFIEMKKGEKYRIEKDKYVIVLSGFLITRATNINGRVDYLTYYSPVYRCLISSAKLIDVKRMVSFVAKENSLLLEIDSRPFTSESEHHSSLHYRFMVNANKALFEILARRDIRTWCAIAPSAREKVMRFLMYFMLDQQTTDLYVPNTREELASYLIIDKSTLLREFRNMRREGIIEYKGRSIKVLKPKEITKHFEVHNELGGNEYA